MLLSDKRILEERDRGNVIIEPFNVDCLGTNSYDVRLGNWYYEERRHRHLEGYPQALDITDKQAPEAMWYGPLDTVAHEERGFITVRPGETVLAHTEEIVGARNGFTTSMRARSSIGRSGLSVCKCAGVGDVGYVNRWTMEISNHTRHILKIPVGLRVAQILFYEVGETVTSYKGKYQRAGLLSAWQPQDMLPRLYRDSDLQQITGRKV